MLAAAEAKTICLGITTAEGEFAADYSPQGLVALHFPGGRAAPIEPISPIPATVRQWHRLTTVAVQAILSGRAPVELPPFDLSRGTKFQQRVWLGMCRIKFGHTQSYGELAVAIGHPKAVRAVGGACGANPIPVLVPCHRVLAANNRMGGFSSGLDWKRKLHAVEKIRAIE